MTEEQKNRQAAYQAAFDFGLQIHKELDSFRYRVIGIDTYTERVEAHIKFYLDGNIERFHQANTPGQANGSDTVQPSPGDTADAGGKQYAEEVL